MNSRYSFMWLILFFDLPTLTKKQRKVAQTFRTNILQEGFQMLQLSVYLKFAPTREKRNQYLDRVQQIIPKEGSVVIFTITDKQYGEAVYFYGCEESQLPASPTLFDYF